MENNKEEKQLRIKEILTTNETACIQKLWVLHHWRLLRRDWTATGWSGLSHPNSNSFLCNILYAHLQFFKVVLFYVVHHRSTNFACIMEESYELDLTYVTERIIAVSFPGNCSEEIYLNNFQDVIGMLKSRHGGNYMVLNLSERRYDFAKLDPKIMEVGWPDFHAPSLNKICNICKAMESWLNSHPQHVVVIHCRGGKGRIGVVISSYMHFTNLSASADQALDRFAMKKFFDDNVSDLMQPSQKRYVQFLSDLLSGLVKMNTNPLFLHYVILHDISNFGISGGCQPFLKLYEGMLPVYTSGVYTGLEKQSRACIAIEPAQLLKGDIMLKCCCKEYQYGIRSDVFRLQFHTGAVQGYGLIFNKEDLDDANKDDHFPENGRVELVFSSSPEKTPVLHSHGPIDGSLYAKVRKKSSSDASIPSRIKGATNNNSDHSDHTLSVSSDSGHSTASVRTEKTEEHPPGIKRILSPQEKEELDQLLSGFGLENSIIPLMEMTDAQSKYSETCNKVPAQVHVNGDVKHKERETDILDDEMPTYDLHSLDSFGTLSSSEGQQSNHLGNLSCHKSYQNSLLSDGFGSNTGEEHHNILAADLGINVDSMYERSFGRIDTKSCQQLSKNPPVSTHSSYSASSYSTQTWVRQQQMVIANQYINTPENEVGFGIHNIVANVGNLENQARVPNTLLQSSSSRSEVQRRLGSISSSSNVVETSEPKVSKLRFLSENGGNNNELKQNTRSSAGVLPSSPTLDIDQSIEQLNRLILDLDPTFEPIPTRIGAATRDSDQLNDLVSHQRDEERLGMGSRFHVKTELLLQGYDLNHNIIFLIFAEPRGYIEDLNHSTVISDNSRTPNPSLLQAGIESVPSHHRPFAATCSPGILNNLANITALPQQDLTVCDGIQTFQNYDETVANSNQLVEEKNLSFMANADESPKVIKSMVGSNCLPHTCLVSSSGYTSQQIQGLQMYPETPLPEKKRVSEAECSFGSVSPSSVFSSPHSGSTIRIPFPNVLPDFSNVGNPPPVLENMGDKHVTVNFVQDTSKFWYKPEISREQAIAVLKNKEAGSFIVRDSHSFRGAYGLAMKVAIPPPSILQLNKKVGDTSNELVRHFLIECTQKGVRLKGCPNEPYFGSLTALVYQHSITPLALPCKLLIPDQDPLDEISEASTQTAVNSAAELLKQGAACNVCYLNSVEMESLTGHQAVQKALTLTLIQEPPPTSTVVHFKVSSQGITLTDNQRKLFFRRHYPVSSVIFCALDPQDRKVFGFVARKQGSATDNVCHLFAEHDPEQPASAVVNFVSKVMIGSPKN
uniref:Tensin 3 n=1 Tax=Pseudonaja textilis TaxID=8673 RepID=A0A670YUP6_PSETE